MTENLIIKRLAGAIFKAGTKLPEDVLRVITKEAEDAQGTAETVLQNIIKNLEISSKQKIPLCQDTGMIIFFVEIGFECRLSCLKNLEVVLNDAVEAAYRDFYFRKSVVTDPIKDRTNTGNNLPPVIHYLMVPGKDIKINFLLKGFGSENCSAVSMMKPTASKEQLVDEVCQIMRKAGGSPCPPVVLGLGIGGTMDYAAMLSKKALVRDIDKSHPDPWYAELENEIMDRLNELNIGPGGLGGKPTALGVNIEKYPTHIAGLPLAVSVNCWADRKGEIRLKGEAE